MKTNTRDITTTAISESLRTFKAKLESHETELTQAWEEFNEVQAKLVMLGREVLGDEMVTGVPEDIENMVREMYRSNEDEQSFKRMMELWDLEAETRVGKLREEVEKIEPEMVKRMTRVEKVGLTNVMMCLVVIDSNSNWLMHRRRSRMCFSLP